MSHFTPWTALAGGALIGLAAVLLLWLNGRIAGVSGIAGGLWFSASGDRAWRVLFLAGLVVGAGTWVAFGGSPAPHREGFPKSLLVIAGLLVGYGTSLSNGCTSGHGVCGVARLALRSLVATAVFLVVAIVTTFVVRHVLHLV
jgi:uncharacterized membrane protein YedE/YeeE